MQVEGTRMLRVRAVAEMFDVSVSTIYRLIQSGRLDAFKMSAGSKRGSLRVPESAVTAFTRACAEAAYPTASLQTGATASQAGEVF